MGLERKGGEMIEKRGKGVMWIKAAVRTLIRTKYIL